MPFRASFSCLWCGDAHTCRGPDDLEGWAQLCPSCVGKAGDNGFLRFRLHQALTERGAAAGTGEASPASMVGAAAPVSASAMAPAAVATSSPPSPDRDAEMLAYYEARAPEYDDWYLRRGRYSHGALADMAWNTDLDAATLWLDALPIGGEIVELAAGTGWWSPLLAQKGQLSIYDAVEEPLDRARARLLAHGLTAHIHVRDAWAEPDRQVDALFCGFWLSHVPRARLVEFLAICRRWLKPGGMFVFVDSRPDQNSGAIDHPAPADDMSVRRLNDGREFTIPKVYYDATELEQALLSAGFATATISTTPKFFLQGAATVA